MGSIWDKLTKEKVVPPPPPAPKPAELQINNPLKLSVGNGVKIDTIDLDGLDFIVRSIREIRRHEGDADYPIIDYDLLARPIGKPELRNRLRLVPVTDKDKGHEYDVILLNFVGKFPYDKRYHDGLAFDQNHGEAQEGDDKFWRVNDVQTEWKANTYLVTEGATAPKYGKLVYWDFWRETKDSDDKTVTEFYFVELEDNSLFEVWRGYMIEQERISTT